MLKNSLTLAVSVAINISMKLCFVSGNGPGEPYLLDEPKGNTILVGGGGMLFLLITIWGSISRIKII
jgi:hypothetical protein